MTEPTATRDQAARLLNEVQALPPETPAAQVTNTLALAQALATLSLHDLIHSALTSGLNPMPGTTHVGGVCVRGHVWALGDEAERDCGSKSWPLYVGPAPLAGEPEDAVVVLRQATAKADDGGRFRPLLATLVAALDIQGPDGEQVARVLAEARSVLGASLGRPVEGEATDV
jgi:hypothetical protein